MYDRDTIELALLALEEGMSQGEAATYRFQLEKQMQTAMEDALRKLMAEPE